MSRTEIKISIFWMLVGVCLLSWPNFGFAQYSSLNYTVQNPVIDSGQQSSASLNFGLGQSFAQMAIGKSTSGSFQLWSGFQYYFQVVANVLTATPADTQVNLSWTVPATYLGITVGSYEVGVGTVSGSYVFSNVGLVTSYPQTGLTNDTPYYFRIKALSPAGSFLVFSNEATATPTGSTLPPGGGGGGGYKSMIVSGQAYPQSLVTLVRDSSIVATTLANITGYFQIMMGTQTAGNYNFTVYATDANGRKSANVNFSASISPTITTIVSDILVSPTITTDFSTIKKGDNLNITGYAQSNSPVTIKLDSSGVHNTYTTTSNNQGKYNYVLNTTSLPFGTYNLKSFAVWSNRQTPDSLPTSFTVSDRNQERPVEECGGRSDLNCDGRVNLIDFSILLYFWESTAFSLNPKVDIDKSGQVGLRDLSIMLYDWTG